MGRRSEYKLSEVKALVEGYSVWRHLKSTNPRGGGLNLLVRLADLDRAIKTLPPKEYQAVLLHGLIGLPEEAVGELLGVRQETVSYRFRCGLGSITSYLNDEDDDKEERATER